MLWNETFWGGFSNSVSATNYVWRFLLWCFGSLVSSLCKNYWDQVPCSTLCKAKWRLWLLRPKRQNLSLLKRSHFPIYKMSFKNHCQSLIYNIVSEASARFYERTRVDKIPGNFPFPGTGIPKNFCFIPGNSWEFPKLLYKYSKTSHFGRKCISLTSYNDFQFGYYL